MWGDFHCVFEVIHVRYLFSGESTLKLQEIGWLIVADSKVDTPNWKFQQFPALTYDSQRSVVVYFGSNMGDLLGETWEYDGTRWQKMTPLQSPPSRYGHSMAYDETRGVIVMFGGSSFDNALLHDTWEYDGITWVQKFPSQASD